MNIILEQKSSWNYSPRVTTEESGLIATLQMLPAHPAPSPGVQDYLLCSGIPALVLGDVSAPAPHGLTSASLTDPVLQALLQGSSKSRVTLFCRRLGTESTSSQRDLCNPRVHGGQPGSSLRVERLTCQMKTGSGSWFVYIEEVEGLDNYLEIPRLIFLTGAQTISKIPLEQGLCCEDHWCQSPV